MFKLEEIGGNIIEAKFSGTMTADEFSQIREQGEDFIEKHKTIRLIVDATECEGWEDLRAVDAHVEMIKEFHPKIEKLALVASKMWQHWIARAVHTFVGVNVKTFEKDQMSEAKEWINS
jgi:hypothetical protein